MNEKIIIRILLKWKIQEQRRNFCARKIQEEGAWRPDAWVTGKHRVIVDHLMKAGLQLPPAIE